MDRLQPGLRVLINTVTRPAPDQLIRRADIKELVGPRYPHPKHFTNVFRQLTKFLFAAPQRFLGLSAFGDISKKYSAAQQVLAVLTLQTGGIAFDGSAVP